MPTLTSGLRNLLRLTIDTDSTQSVRFMLYQHKEQDIFLCSPSNIFQVVINVEKYPDFIPWCKAVYIKKKS